MVDLHLPHIHDVFQRLETILTFTIVRFVQTLLTAYASNFDILLVAIMIALISYVVSFEEIHSLEQSKDSSLVEDDYAERHIKSIGFTISGPALLIFIQSVIASLRPQDDNPSSAFNVANFIVSSTCLVLLLGILPKRMMQTSHGQRFSKLVMYMYADSTSILFNNQDIDAIIPLLSVLLIVSLSLISKYYHLKKMTVIGYFTEALNVALINVLLQSLFSQSMGHSHVILQILQMVLVLVILEYCTHILYFFDNLKGYALWKVSDLIFEIASTQFVGQTEIAAVAFLTSLLWQLMSDFKSTVIFDLCSLVALNGFLDWIQHSITTTSSKDASFMFSSVLITLHVFMQKFLYQDSH